MQQSCGILNSESMRVERCGCTGIVHWTGAPPVTALPSTAALAHCVTFKMILNTHTYSEQEFSSYPSCMFYRAFTTDVISINEYVILSRGHFHNRQMLCGEVEHNVQTNDICICLFICFSLSLSVLRRHLSRLCFVTFCLQF